MTYNEEVLVVTMEECAEVTQACSKIVRFGTSLENLDSLEKEVGDLLCMLDLLQQSELISWTRVEQYAEAKREKLKKFSNLIDD